MLIAVSGGHVVGWHVARSETGTAWSSLLSRIAPPLAAVCDGGDGGDGALKELREIWPSTRVQHCPCSTVPPNTTASPTKPRTDTHFGL